MILKEKNRLKMYKAVIAVCNESRDLVRKHTVFTQTVSELMHAMTQIDKMINAEEIRRKKTIDAFMNLKMELSERFSLISFYLSMYAKSKNDFMLSHKSNYTRVMLDQMSHAGLINTCTQLLNTVRSSEELIMKINLTSEELTLLENMIADYKAMYVNPDSLQGNNRFNKLKLNAIFNRCDYLLKNHTDQLIKYFQAENPEFYNKYRNARKLSNTAKPTSASR